MRLRMGETSATSPCRVRAKQDFRCTNEAARDRLLCVCMCVCATHERDQSNEGNSYLEGHDSGWITEYCVELSFRVLRQHTNTLTHSLARSLTLYSILAEKKTNLSSVSRCAAVPFDVEDKTKILNSKFIRCCSSSVSWSIIHNVMGITIHKLWLHQHQIYRHFERTHSIHTHIEWVQREIYCISSVCV